MPRITKRSDIEKLKARAAELRKIARESKSKVARHIAKQMAIEIERALDKDKRSDGKS